MQNRTWRNEITFCFSEFSWEPFPNFWIDSNISGSCIYMLALGIIMLHKSPKETMLMIGLGAVLAILTFFIYSVTYFMISSKIAR